MPMDATFWYACSCRYSPDGALASLPNRIENLLTARSEGSFLTSLLGILEAYSRLPRGPLPQGNCPALRW